MRSSPVHVTASNYPDSSVFTLLLIVRYGELAEVVSTVVRFDLMDADFDGRTGINAFALDHSVFIGIVQSFREILNS